MTEPFHAGDHATPITPAERDGLIPTHVTLRSELNELEQRNIAEADSWAFARKRGVLGEPFLLGLHRRMFGHVWRWAGQYRNSDRTNLGVKPHLIQPELRQAIDDAQYWVDHKSYQPDGLAVRFHHRLVAIHPFPNGNGRWSRLVADLLIVRLSGSRFTWGRANLQAKGDVRRAYINALQAADKHNFTSLVAFARS